MLIRLLPTLLILGSLALPATAAATVRGGFADDPREGRPVGDAAAASARHDDVTGDLTLVVRLHDPAPADAPTASWTLGGARGARGCDPAAAVAGVEHALETGTATVEVRADADDEAAAVPARVTRSADGREVRVDARDARLAGRTITCAQVQLSGGDEVVAVDLTEGGAAGVAGPDSAPGPPPAGPPAPAPGGSPSPGGGGTTPGGGPSAVPGVAPGTRVSRLRVAFSRRGRTTTVTLRALVCAPTGTVRLLATERRTRRATPRRTTTVRHRFTRRQRSRCQQHRLTWRFRSTASQRLTVRLAVVAAAGASRGR